MSRGEASIVGLPEAVGRVCGSAGYLSDGHRESARRLVRMIERAQLRQRVTMSYDPTRIGHRGANNQDTLAGTAAEARARLNDLARAMPPDCWGVVIDVCGFDKGLQQIELEKGWPRRSAKLVLRIALDQLAAHWHLGAEASGTASGRVSAWLPERPPMFADDVQP